MKLFKWLRKKNVENPSEPSADYAENLSDYDNHNKIKDSYSVRQNNYKINSVKELKSLKEKPKNGILFPNQETEENSAITISRERKQIRWMDEILKESEKNGEFDNLPGKGKPLNVQSGNVLNSILKNANILPPWLELQHEIRDDIKKLLDNMNDENINYINCEIEKINKKITEYNNKIPTPILHKSYISSLDIIKKYSEWE